MIRIVLMEPNHITPSSPGCVSHGFRLCLRAPDLKTEAVPDPGRLRRARVPRARVRVMDQADSIPDPDRAVAVSALGVCSFRAFLQGLLLPARQFVFALFRQLCNFLRLRRGGRFGRHPCKVGDLARGRAYRFRGTDQNAFLGRFGSFFFLRHIISPSSSQRLLACPADRRAP